MTGPAPDGGAGTGSLPGRAAALARSVWGRNASIGYPAGVSSLFAFQNGVMLIITVVMFAIKAFAFVDAVSRRQAQFVAADKQTKQFWLIILGLALVANMVIWWPMSLLNLAGIVAALVYLAGTRPALQSLSGRR